jgi:site-specific DNA-adenine methylase
MLTNSAMARPLYEGRWNILEVGVDRSISCKVGQRAKAKEIVVTNYADLCL